MACNTSHSHVINMGLPKSALASVIKTAYVSRGAVRLNFPEVADGNVERPFLFWEVVMGEAKLAMDTAQLAAAVGLSASTIRRERREGRLRATVVRGRVLYQSEDVKTWLGGAAGQQEVV
jgi:hypothetical protein